MLRCLVLCALTLGSAIVLAEAKPLTKNQSSSEKEIELALQAAPVHLRKEATVYVFGKRGYEKARTGTNGFSCLVNRDGTQNGSPNVFPTCWDAEGSRTILPVMLRVGELIAQGKSAAEIKNDIAAGFDQGRFHSPAKTGIAYMLAGDVKFDAKTGQFGTVEFPPHYMIYAPGVSNADIGTTGEAMKQTPGLPFRRCSRYSRRDREKQNDQKII